jgi:hypothetical protein
VEPGCIAPKANGLMPAALRLSPQLYCRGNKELSVEPGTLPADQINHSAAAPVGNQPKRVLKNSWTPLAGKNTKPHVAASGQPRSIGGTARTKQNPLFFNSPARRIP